MKSFLLGFWDCIFYWFSEHIWNQVREFNKSYYPNYRLIFPTAVVVNLLNPDDIEVIIQNV